jgi:hypothetical protein
MQPPDKEEDTWIENSFSFLPEAEKQVVIESLIAGGII